MVIYNVITLIKNNDDAKKCHTMLHFWAGAFYLYFTTVYSVVHFLFKRIMFAHFTFCEQMIIIE